MQQRDEMIRGVPVGFPVNGPMMRERINMTELRDGPFIDDGHVDRDDGGWTSEHSLNWVTHSREP